VLNGAAIRAALRERLMARRPLGGRVVDEVTLDRGRSRIDVLDVTEAELHGYEIKGASDSLSRLPSQVASYGRVLDRATLIATERHADQALDLLPEWWGFDRAEERDGVIALVPVRLAAANPGRDLAAVVDLMWVSEQRALYRARLPGRWYAREAWQQIPADDLSAHVRQCLIRHLGVWRARASSAIAAQAPRQEQQRPLLPWFAAGAGDS
jgi:hypothetical protein